MNRDGTMARGPQVVRFSEEYGFPIVTIEDILHSATLQRLQNCS
jgi:3,4-dihydroxy-2-butanone 4-phosphate synthase